MHSNSENGDKSGPRFGAAVAIADMPNEGTAGTKVAVKRHQDTSAPLTTAVFRTRFLTALATPCHGRGEAFTTTGGTDAQ